MDQRLFAPRFPRSSKYNPEWIIASASGGANPLWLTEWLTESLPLQPGMRVLDLGCGRAMSSIFLQREFGVEAWAVDLWCDAAENHQRIRDAGLDQHIFPLRTDARTLPFAAEFFDVILSIDSYIYYGTDDFYLPYLARLLKPGGYLGIAGSGMVKEVTGPIPEHLTEWWGAELEMWSLHAADWWRRHWEKSGFIQVDVADTLPDGWKYWLDWHHTICPENHVEIAAISADQGRTLGYVRVIGRRTDRQAREPITAVPSHYNPHPLLREPT